MYEESKQKIICPRCNDIAGKSNYYDYYLCHNCNWTSNDNCVDIAYKDALSAPLSNLFPHEFDFYLENSMKDMVYCLSMESFLQSLKIPDRNLQQSFCENYSGYMAYKMRLTLPDWREKQILYWHGREYERSSEEYTELITMAYDRLFYGNDIFREIVLPKFKGKYLIHSMGNEDTTKTVLTESEYRFQLNRLMDKI